MSESKASEVPVKECIDDILQLSSIRDDGKRSLVDILESFRGRKCLFYDKQVFGILSQLAPDLKKFFSEEVSLHYFRELKYDVQDVISTFGKDIPENIIYLVRPDLATMKIIAEHIKGLLRAGFPLRTIFINMICMLI